MAERKPKAALSAVKRTRRPVANLEAPELERASVAETKINQFRKRRYEAIHAGGEPKGRLSARTRIDLLLDKGSFVELDLYAKSRVQMRDILAKRGLPTDEDHAGIPDTSSLLYLETQGQWVRKDKIALADAKNGVRGHPQHASAELGKIYLDLKVDLAVKQVRALLAASR